jgi:hypothetical protein
MIGSPFNDLLIGQVLGQRFYISPVKMQVTVDDNFSFESVETVQGGSAVDTLDLQFYLPVGRCGSDTSSTENGNNAPGHIRGWIYCH